MPSFAKIGGNWVHVFAPPYHHITQKSAAGVVFSLFGLPTCWDIFTIHRQESVCVLGPYLIFF